MNLAASMELFTYWNDLRGDTPAPVRQNIEPEKIRHLLPELFILSASGKTPPQFRLTGTRLYSIFGRELHATPFLSLWADENARTMADIANTVMQREVPAILTVRGITADETEALHYEMLLLPLRSSHDSEPRLLGGLFAENRKHVYVHNVYRLHPESCRLIEPVVEKPQHDSIKFGFSA